jgi:broad specificity phosphatase PhoE
MATARILLEGTLTPLTLEPRFIEIDLGDFEGQLEEDLRTKLGSKYDDWRRQNYAVAPPNGGENIFDVVERVRGALCSIRRAAVEGEVLIVGHQVSNMAMKIAMSGRFEPDKADMLRQNNDEVEVWDFAQGVRIEQFKIVVAASKGRV